MASVFFTMDVGRAHFEPQMDNVRYGLYFGVTPNRSKEAAMVTDVDRGFRS